MPDKEKVTYGLRCMCYGDVECKECPYARNGSGWHDCRSNCAKDALELLKEQEAVKIEVKKINNSGRCGRCPNCLMELNEVDYPNYCGNCGQAVKWE